MKKIFTLFLCTSFGAFAQSDQPAVKFRRFAAGINFSPDIAYRTPHNYQDESLQQWESTKESDKKSFGPRLGFSTGGHVSYNITRRLSVESGAQFSLKGYRHKPAVGAMFYGNQLLFKGIMKSHYNFNFVDVPLSLSYVLFDGRLQMVATAGFTWNHMHRSSIKQFLKEEVNDQFVPVMVFNTPYHENTFSYTVGLGIQYNVNERVMLKAVPTFRYAILPIQTNLAPSAYYWNAGLNMSCSVRLF